MDRNDFQKLLEQGGCPSVLLFEGEEEQLKHAAFRRLEKVLLPEGMEQMNESILDNPDTDQLIASVETMPFLSDRRLVVVRDYPPLMGRAEADEKLVAYLPSVPSSSVLLFYCTGKPDGRKKLYAAVRKLNGIVSFSPLRGAELTRFVTDAFKMEGKECDARTAEYLVFTSGDDTGLLLTEIAKIASYAGDRPAVTADDVSALATPSAECTVFQMIDAVVSGQKNKAFLLLRNLLRSGSDRVGIIAMLLRQYRILQHIKIMQYEKQPKEYIRSALGLPPFAVDQNLRQAAACSGGQVRKAVSLCFETEYGVKSGRLQQDSALDALILKLLVLRLKDKL